MGKGLLICLGASNQLANSTKAISMEKSLLFCLGRRALLFLAVRGPFFYMNTRLLFILLLVIPLCALSEDLLRKHSASPLQAESMIDALEPWETPIAGFFIRSHHGVPVVSDRDAWIVEIDGLVERPLRLTLKVLKELPKKSLHAVLECSGNGRGLQRPRAAGVQWERGAVGNGEWGGVSIAEILAKAGVKAEARFARIEGADKPSLPTVPAFVRSIPLSKLKDPQSLLAWEMNREVMPVLHGGPLRLVLPGWYGQNWLKWVTHITLTVDEDSGMFMKKGYRMPKKPLKPGEKWDSATGYPIQELRVQSLIASPRPNEPVRAGVVTIKGHAFSGSGPISKVELSVDGGKHWTKATVEPIHSDGGWQDFHGDVTARALGAVVVLSRATDQAGNTQPMKADWNPSGYLRNAAEPISFFVTKKEPVVAADLVSQHCRTCHAMGLIESQRLSLEGWDKVVTKMEGYGAKFTPEERARVVVSLSRLSPKSPPASAILTSYAVEKTLYDPEPTRVADLEKGATLYQTHCAACHGEQGEGKLGPRLLGRSIPGGVFWFAVYHGAKTMPSFEGSLKDDQINDIKSFLGRG